MCIGLSVSQDTISFPSISSNTLFNTRFECNDFKSSKVKGVENSNWIKGRSSNLTMSTDKQKHWTSRDGDNRFFPLRCTLCDIIPHGSWSRNTSIESTYVAWDLKYNEAYFHINKNTHAERVRKISFKKTTHSINVNNNVRYNSAV